MPKKIDPFLWMLELRILALARFMKKKKFSWGCGFFGGSGQNDVGRGSCPLPHRKSSPCIGRD